MVSFFLIHHPPRFLYKMENPSLWWGHLQKLFYLTVQFDQTCFEQPDRDHQTIRPTPVTCLGLPPLSATLHLLLAALQGEMIPVYTWGHGTGKVTRSMLMENVEESGSQIHSQSGRYKSCLRKIHYFTGQSSTTLFQII